MRWTGKLTPPRSGLYALGLRSDDGSRLYLDGKLVIDAGAMTGQLPGKVLRGPGYQTPQ